MSLASKKLKKEISSSPMRLVSMIIDNNPEGVAAALRYHYGEVVNANDPQGIIDGISHQIEMYPHLAKEILVNVLSVPVNTNRLSEVDQDWFLNELIDNESAGAGKKEYRTGGGGPPAPDIDISPTAGEMNGSSSSSEDDDSFDWGAVVTGLLPGIMAGFGIGQTNASNTSGSAPKKDYTWIWLVVIVMLIILAIVLFKKKQ